MIIAFLHGWGFFTAEHVLTDSPVELVGLASIIALGIGAYHKIECHAGGCHRIGHFTHGHFHLCARHHPDVPSDGKITAAHINAIKPRE